jgi:hypothetical protein
VTVDRVCPACEVGWKSADESCWSCRQPGVIASIQSLMRPPWPTRNWIGFSPFNAMVIPEAAQL